MGMRLIGKIIRQARADSDSNNHLLSWAQNLKISIAKKSVLVHLFAAMSSSWKWKWREPQPASMSFFFLFFLPPSQLEWGHFGRLSSRTRPQRAPDCRERDAELLPVTAHWSPDGPQGLPDWHHPRPGRRQRGGGRGRGCMEVEVGIGDNQQPMHLSISYRWMGVGRRLVCHAPAVAGRPRLFQVTVKDKNYSAYNR